MWRIFEILKLLPLDFVLPKAAESSAHYLQKTIQIPTKVLSLFNALLLQRLKKIFHSKSFLN